jgi:hypothetical protein
VSGAFDFLPVLQKKHASQERYVARNAFERLR